MTMCCWSVAVLNFVDSNHNVHINSGMNNIARESHVSVFKVFIVKGDCYLD